VKVKKYSRNSTRLKAASESQIMFESKASRELKAERAHRGWKATPTPDGQEFVAFS
jgi:hypothetical protein